MSGSVFTPNISQPAEVEVEELVLPTNDETGAILLKVAQYAVIALFALVSVFFMPGLWATLGFSKVLLTVIVGVVVVISVSLLMLRRKQARTVLPVSLGIFWGIALVALVSGVLSGDVQDAIRGSAMETQTAAFLAVMAAAMTVPLVLQGSKIMSIKALVVFSLVSSLLLGYNILRLIFGAEFFALGSFSTVTVSPIGGFNDLAIFSGLTVIIGLVTLAQLPLKSWIQYSISGLIAMALVMLSVVNFFNIWIVVGFFGLLLFVYLLSRDTLFQSDSESTTQISRSLVLTTMVVCLVSALFIVAGEYTGGKISEFTNVNYVEVRPSVGATIDIASAVYKEDFLLGIGPNRFSDAWRQYRDQSINETIFWDTDFSSGSGYIPTLFVDLGILGGLMILLFHGYFLYLGYRMLLRGTSHDSYWYYFGVVSFAAAVFLWGMSYVYVPGAGILLLTALFTGFTFVAFNALVPSAVKTIPLAVNRQRGFFLMAAIIFVITASIGVLFSIGEQYVAQAQFSESQATAQSIAEFEQVALSSFDLYSDDRFVGIRAQIHLASLNTLVSTPEPTAELLQQFGVIAEQAVVFAEQAVAEDPTNPDYYALLAGIYSNLAAAGFDGAQERAETSLQVAQDLDPLNPSYRLMAAQMAVRIGDVPKARGEILAALNLKRNYTEALFLSAQLDINEGNVESAISTTRAIISLEPNNQTRYFQLGFLLAANENFTEAVIAYKAAVSIDPDYANARYMLALAYLNSNQTELALEQLKVVQITNLENQQLSDLIQQVERGEFVSSPELGLETPVSDSVPGEGFDDSVVTSEDVGTDLVSPVNTGSDSDDKTIIEPDTSSTSQEVETSEESVQ